jgi:hypothetical protein
LITFSTGWKIECSDASFRKRERNSHHPENSAACGIRREALVRRAAETCIKKIKNDMMFFINRICHVPDA